MVQVVAPEIAEQRGKVKGTCPLAVYPRSEFPRPPRPYRPPYSNRGTGILDSILGKKPQKRGFGVRIIRLGIESKAGAADRAAWTLGEESRDARWCPASSLQATARCPLGPDLGSAAAGPPVSLLLQSSADRDQNRVMLLGILRFRGSQKPQDTPGKLGTSPDEKFGSPGPASGWERGLTLELACSG